MSEEEIAEKYVKPYLMKLGFPDELISGYGKVPIQTGPFGVRYADYMCYVVRGENKKPYMIVEVKRLGEKLDYSQPEFYAFMSNAPFFSITNGREWRWYLRGNSQGKSIRLINPPTPFEIAKPEIRVPTFEISSDVKRFIASFEQKLDQDDVYCIKNNLTEHREDGCYGCPVRKNCLLGDTIWHATCTDRIRNILQEAHIKSMSSENLIELFGSLLDWLMYKPPVLNVILSGISENPEAMKKALYSLYDENVSIKDRFDESMKIKGFGPFMASQFLSSVNKKKYIVIEANVLEALRSLNMIEIVPQDIRGRDYLYINEVCNNLMQKGFQKWLELGLALVHNFLWHLERAYRTTGDWMGF